MKKLSNILLLFITLTFLIIPFLITAETTVPNPNPGTTVNNPPGGGMIEIKNPFKGGSSIPALIETIVRQILMPIGGVIAVLMIMYAGFLYVTAAGDPGQIKKAHDALLYAVIGAAILLGAFAISTAIQGTINELRV